MDELELLTIWLIKETTIHWDGRHSRQYWRTEPVPSVLHDLGWKMRVGLVVVCPSPVCPCSSRAIESYG
jgi:hypothetical protein